MGIALPDATLTMLYDQLVLTLAYFAYLVARNISAYGSLYPIFVFLLLEHLLVWVYQLFNGLVTLAQVGPPLVI